MSIVAKVDADEATLLLAESIRALLDADVWEEEKAKMIYAKHQEITQEQYLQVWEILDSRTRSAWKAYQNEGRCMAWTRS